MNLTSQIAAASVLALALATSASAQSTLTGVESLNDRIDDIQDAATDDLDRGNDAARFGPNNVPQGWRGSLAFSAASTSGSTDTGEVSLASRLTYGIGAWSHSIGLAGEYGRSGSRETKKEFFGTYEADRYFTDQFYVFGLGRYQYDKFSTTEKEAFLGFGPGYRIVNTDKVTWRVQAGPGVRYVKESNGDVTTEGSAIASSRVYYGLTDTMSLTNDTDVIHSDIGTLATNDFGVNFKVTDTLSTRFGYRTEYDSEAAEEYDNKLSVSLVVGF